MFTLILLFALTPDEIDDNIALLAAKNQQVRIQSYKLLEKEGVKILSRLEEEAQTTEDAEIRNACIKLTGVFYSYHNPDMPFIWGMAKKDRFINNKDLALIYYKKAVIAMNIRNPHYKVQEDNFTDPWTAQLATKLLMVDMTNSGDNPYSILKEMNVNHKIYISYWLKARSQQKFHLFDWKVFPPAFEEFIANVKAEVIEEEVSK